MGWTPSGFSRFQHFNFGQDARRLSFQAKAHAVVVGLGKLAGFKFKTQIAQVFIDHFFALIQVSGPGFDDSSVGISAGIENVNQDAGCEHATYHFDDVIKDSRSHSSVSRRARSRRTSRSGARFMSAAATGAGPIFPLRIKRTTSIRPRPRPAAGRIQANSSKPCVEGSTTAVTPHLVRNQFSTASSSFVRAMLARSSRIIWSELGQPT